MIGQKVIGQTDLFKHDSGGVINIDPHAYARAKKRKAEKQRVANLEGEVAELRKLVERLIKNEH